MESLMSGLQSPGGQVSIPFKREGAWKVKANTSEGERDDLVSIPFKREGAWKVTW